MIELVLYTRSECCLCEEMKGVVEEASRGFGARLSLVDVDSDPELAREYGDEVPVLFVDGSKFAKYRADARRLRRRLEAAQRS